MHIYMYMKYNMREGKKLEKQNIKNRGMWIDGNEIMEEKEKVGTDR